MRNIFAPLLVILVSFALPACFASALSCDPRPEPGEPTTAVESTGPATTTGNGSSTSDAFPATEGCECQATVGTSAAVVPDSRLDLSSTEFRM